MTQGCAVPWSGDFEKQIVCPVEQAVIVKLLYTFGGAEKHLYFQCITRFPVNWIPYLDGNGSTSYHVLIL